MKKITEKIIETNLNIQGPIKERKTVRAIILNDQKELLMLYSTMFNDYTFPGGGIKINEDPIEGLKRELREEIGAIDIEIISEIGATEELRYGIKGSDQVYHQTSFYYLVSILKQGKPKLEGREQLQGLSSVWIKPHDALTHNLSVMSDALHQTKGLKTVLIRENEVLKYMKENKII